MQPNEFNSPSDNRPEDVDVKEESVREDLGNHEHEDVVEPPHVNDEGELVDSDGNKVFTTNEEALKDGSMVLDRKGRQPGIYLDDLEEEQNRLRQKRYEEAYGQSTEGTHSVVERQVNVVNSPLPPVTTRTVQEHPLTQETDSELEKDDVDRSVHLDHNSDVVAESETEKVQ